MLPIRAVEPFLAFLAERRKSFYPEIEARVREILARVKEGGDAALVEMMATPPLGPGCDLSATGLKVSEAEYAAAEAAVAPDVRAAIEQSIGNVRSFHEPQVPRSWFQTRPDGSILGQQVTPLDRVGVYVPGGAAPLFSCLYMVVVPARVAGVREVILCTPPNRNGRIDPHMLVAARLCGVDAVYKLGGAQAVGAMAYGTASVPAVDKVAGPGNYYVTLAKKLVFGPVGIDMLAGPTEVVAIADAAADPQWLAADLLSQAEHPDGMVILITTAAAQARAVGEAMAKQVEHLPRAAEMKAGVRDLGAALVVDSLAEACRVANAIAPEHLELEVADPWALLPLIRNAGAVFLGQHTPEAMGDYIAGPSNVIPTEGTGRYASAVNVETFVKRTSVCAYSPAAFAAQAPAAVRLALAEDLPAHAASLQIRLQGGRTE